MDPTLTSLRTRVFPPLQSWGVVILLSSFPPGLGCFSSPPSFYGCCLSGDLLPPLVSFTMPPLILSMGTCWPRHRRFSSTRDIKFSTTLARTLLRIVGLWVCRPRQLSPSIASPTTFVTRAWRFWPAWLPRRRPAQILRAQRSWPRISLLHPRARLWLVNRRVLLWSVRPWWALRRLRRLSSWGVTLRLRLGLP